MRKFEDKERKDSKIKAIVEVKNFLLFHKKRIRLLKKLLKENNDGRLIFQVSVLGLESLARVLYPNEDSKTRFIRFLSKEMKKNDAIRFYLFCRNPLVHEGFLTPFSSLELWDEGNVGFITTYEKYLDAEIIGSVDYPPETALAIYEDLIWYTEDFFKKRNIKSRALKDVKVYGVPSEAKKIKRRKIKFQKRKKWPKNLT